MLGALGNSYTHREPLHERFERWLDELETQLPESQPTLAQGFRFYLLDGDRIVHVLSWHQVQSESELGEALQEVKDAGLIPEETVRLCVMCDGAEWIGKHVQALFPDACQVLDYYHGSEYRHKVAKAQYSNPLQALEWVESTLTRLYMGKVGWVLGGLRRMQPASEEARKAIDNCWVYLNAHRGR